VQIAARNAKFRSSPTQADQSIAEIVGRKEEAAAEDDNQSTLTNSQNSSTSIINLFFSLIFLHNSHPITDKNQTAHS